MRKLPSFSGRSTAAERATSSFKKLDETASGLLGRKQRGNRVLLGLGAAVVLSSVVIAVLAANSAVVELTDANFEHDTQASTGGTTGTWFVKFYAPWCGHCKAMAPAWEELAAKLKGKINVAKLDARSNTITAKRFRIQGFPTLFLLHQGKMYEYRGERSVDKMKAFAEEEWKSTEAKDIPSPLSTWDVLKDEVISSFLQLQGIVYHAPLPSLLLLLAGVLLGCLISALFMFLCTKRDSRVRSAPVVSSRTVKKKD